MWVGVAQLPYDVSNSEIEQLSKIGVRALRFNLFRGNSMESNSSDKKNFELTMSKVFSLAERVATVANWHAEFYADAQHLSPFVTQLTQLPRPIVLDHLGVVFYKQHFVFS